MPIAAPKKLSIEDLTNEKEYLYICLIFVIHATPHLNNIFFI